MTTLKLTFTNEKGIELSARLDLPEAKAKAYAIFAHGFGGSKDTLVASRISRALTNEDIAVLRFDFTGLGASEGEFVNTTFSTNVCDIIAAAKYLEQNYEAPKLLIGHSLGGAAVLVAASKLPEVRAVSTIGTPSNPSHVQHHFKDQLETITTRGASDIKIAGKDISISHDFIKDIEKYDLEEIVRDFNKAYLIFHSPTDMVVSIMHAGILYRAARHPKSFLALDGADHNLTKAEDAEYVATILAAWMKRYIV